MDLNRFLNNNNYTCINRYYIANKLVVSHKRCFYKLN